jgi:hypothetical protein
MSLIYLYESAGLEICDELIAGGSGIALDGEVSHVYTLKFPAEGLVDSAMLEKLSDREFIGRYLSVSAREASPTVTDSSRGSSPAPPKLAPPVRSASAPPRLEWLANAKRLPVVAIISTELPAYTIPQINLALGVEAFSLSYVGLQLHVGARALFLHLSLPDPESAASTLLLLYVFSLAHVVILWHPRAYFDPRWLRRLKNVSKLQRSPAGSKIITHAKSLRSTVLGPCKIVPLLASVITCPDPPPDLDCLRAQIHALIMAAAIPCHLADSPVIAAELPLNTTPASLFSLLSAPPVGVVSPVQSLFADPCGAPPADAFARFLTELLGPLASNRRLPTAKMFLSFALALHGVFFVPPPPSSFTPKELKPGPGSSLAEPPPRSFKSPSSSPGPSSNGPAPNSSAGKSRAARSKNNKSNKAFSSRSLPSINSQG